MGVERVIAVDLGGTHIRVAVVDHDGTLAHRRSIPTHAQQGPTAVIHRMGDLINAVASDGEVPTDAPIGVASPGPLDARAGLVLFTPNLPGWRDVPIVDMLGRATGRQVAIANDGNCAALGEIQFGLARGVGDLVYLALGTGVGGGVVSNGHLVDGVRGLGAEVGHVVVALDGPRCSCGAIGCLEAFAAGWAIQREAELVATTADGEAMIRVADGGPLHAGVVAEAARQGDPAARRILERSGRALGAAIGAFINLFNPRLVVIGGGVARLGDLLLEPARAAIPQHSFIDARQDVRLELSALGADTGVFGAAALAMATFGQTDLHRLVTA